MFCLVNCVCCIPCWGALAYYALKPRLFIVDFNEKEGRVDVKEVGVLRGNLISERSIPYSQISKAGMRPTNVSINDEPAFVVTLQLTDSTIVDVSPE